MLADRPVLLSVTALVAVLSACGPSAPRAITPFALPTFTAAPIAAATAPPTITPAPQPTASPPPTSTTQVQTVYVANTGGEGVYLRRTPALGDRVKAYPDGTALATIGSETQAEGQAWLQVRAPDGTEGWVPQRYTALAPPVPQPAVVPTPTSPPLAPAAPPAITPAPAPKPVIPAAPPPVQPTAGPKPVIPVAPPLAKPTAAPVAPKPAPPPPARTCCRTCTTGKACGDSCIAAHLNCNRGVGCACNAWEGEPPGDLSRDEPNEATMLAMGDTASDDTPCDALALEEESVDVP
jgi:hypothetical protein